MNSTLKSNHTPADLEIEASTIVYDGYFKLKAHRLRHRLFSGAWSIPLVREVFYSGPAVTVLPYDPIRDEVLLIEQFRMAAHPTSPTPWLIEVIAGRIDGDETPEEAVAREANEEANIELKNLKLIASIYTAPGFADEILHHYCGSADLAKAGGIYGLEGEQENIRAVVIPFEDALNAVNSGEITTGPAITSLYWLALNRDILRQHLVE